MSKTTWAIEFCPSYAPIELLDMGIMMDSYYFAASKVASKYKKHPKALKRGDKKDASKNYYGVASREKLWQWKKRNAIFTDKCGWLEWYFLYFEGRRLGDEDAKQIKRWKSFVARHQGQIVKAGVTKDKSKRLKQRQGLLQWAWDSTTKVTEQQREKNLKKIAKAAGVPIEIVSTESLPVSANW